MRAGPAPAGPAPVGLAPAGPAPVDLFPELVRWQRLHGRHDLPWQGNADPYRIWLSEVMLQQTQVVTVVPYFNAFIAAFPTVSDLAAAPIDQVMSLWSGLGYYSRARNLHAAAKHVVDRHGGRFPASGALLAELPGVGQSTAAAVAVFGFGERAAILDGNVKRVFCRIFGIEGHPGETAVMRRLWAHAQAELPPAGTPAVDLQAYTQGLMDLGATLCTRVRPACERCPLQAKCVAYRNDAVLRYPVARPRRPVPVREVEMLLLCSGARVLIEQRPPAGIWGGLWSLPEMDAGEGGSLAQDGSLAQRDQRGQSLFAAGVALPLARIRLFARFEHAFTHFRMRARVWQAELDDVEAGAALRQTIATRWLALGDAKAAPLPRPVKTLLQSMSDNRPDTAGLLIS